MAIFVKVLHSTFMKIIYYSKFSVKLSFTYHKVISNQKKVNIKR